ncbi:GIY-YIG nuclease family protein [Mycobacterium sp. 360MFTsu5.1]|uniref:GIY-YIG nuclease family protein n=1 Tax=Mycobacterium sp. 360MFTsu5.1 TaxID=1172186 RepID=UPI0003A8D5CC|nr:GIY-YIG nuclease family protein [Mycobacterium sp. 360MFTsu5.1]
MATIALAISGQYWFASSGRSGSVSGGAASPAQQFADAAMAAFSGSTTIAVPNPAWTPAQQAAGLPADPVAGLTSATPAGPVQQVLPAGLGAAQHTSSGSVVYPDRGAGFDFLAENTGTGTRTVARINSPTGVRMVTTFVRTPADTVMLAHTNGYLTINRATPAAETVGMFAPAETRDAAGKLVPSSYVARQLRPGLYQLSEVFDPRPDTQWPVYVDPPLHVGGPGGGPLPAGLFDSITSTVSSAANAVSSAMSSAASATVSGAKAVGTFVKNNPMETAIIVAGAAVAVTGVGGPAGAAAIAAAVANVSAAGLQIASEAMPDNRTLGVMSTVANAATMFTPSGAAKKIAEEGAELVAKQALTHTDDVIDAAKVVPNPGQVREEIAAAGAAGKPPLPGVDTPKAPHAPPAVTAPEPPAGSPGAFAPRGADEPKGGVYVIHDENMNPVYVGKTNNLDTRLYTHAGSGRGAKLEPGDHIQVYRTDDPDLRSGIEQHLMRQHDTLNKGRPQDNPLGRNRMNGIGPDRAGGQEMRARGQQHVDGLARQPEITRLPDRVQRRLDGQARSQQAADMARSEAVNNACQSGRSRDTDRGESHGDAGHSSKNGGNRSSKKAKPKRKSKQHHSHG